VDDFSIFDDPEDPVAEFKKLGGSCLIEGSSLGGLIAIVPSRDRAKDFPYAVCYTPEEVGFVLSYPDDKAKMLHLMKQRMGGTIEVGKVEHATG
jgi:hypothetical protein